MEISEKEMAYAVKTLDTICAMLDDDELKYARIDEHLTVVLEFDGHDFPLKILFRVVPERELVILYSPLSFTIPEDGRHNVALALTMINDCIYDGIWVEDLGTGQVQFRITNSYRDSILGKECFKSLMENAIYSTDSLADKLFMVGKGNMTLQQFYDSVFGGE